jgi:hypothetical protein
VKKGLIVSVPFDGNGPTAAGVIADGKCTAKVSLGRKQGIH